mgnify:FL=1
MKKRIVSKCMSDEAIHSMRGKYVDDDSYDILVTTDTDCYTDDGKLLFKFRKNLANENQSEIAFLAFKKLAKPSRGRGAAAGYIDPDAVYWKKRKLVKYSKWSANYEVNGNLSKMKIQNEVASNPIGFYGETNSLGVKLPCRLSHYTRQEFLKYDEGIPYIQMLADSYKELNPDMYWKQKEQIYMNPLMKIADTPFSTVTVNRNFRTGIHCDKGDFGFGNLSVLEYGSYSGGYFVFPQYRIAIDMRKGDHLCCDVHQYHSNTELYETEADKEINDCLPDIFKDNLEIGVLGLNNRFARISLVCYLREDLVNCSSQIQEELLLPEFNENKMKVFYINLQDESSRRQKFFTTNYIRFPASTRDYVSEDLDKKMISYYNLPRQEHLGKCACWMSHINLLQKIVDMKLNGCLILEDDAIQLGKLPKTCNLPKDGITYFGGSIFNKKILDRSLIEIDHQKGMNELDQNKYQMIYAMSYYIPSWIVALEIL